MSTEAPLAKLSKLSNTEFPNLFRAREDSEEKLEARRSALSGLGPDPDASVIYMGSIGRLEATEGSDDDFMLLVDRRGGDDTESSLHINRVREIIDAIPDSNRPSDQGIFNNPVHLRDLVYNIGLAADDNANTTRRMLFLLESNWAFGESCYQRSLDRILSRYLDESVKNRHPPRFMLNDVVRYWRTMCVDFAGKARQGPEKWGIRNAKLGTSRKILFAGGLLPILDCHRLEVDQIREQLPALFSLCPTDRIASSFLLNDMVPEGGRALVAYDEFVGILSDRSKREELKSLDKEEALKSSLYLGIKELGDQIQSELTNLLFDSEDLAAVTRKYGIF